MTRWIKLLLIALMPAALVAAASAVPGSAGVDVTLKRAYAGYFKEAAGKAAIGTSRYGAPAPPA